MSSVVIPSGDGEINQYNLRGSAGSATRVYFVNGIRVSGEDHARTASLLSIVTDHPINGVYNKTSGAVSGLYFDLKQCVMDYLAVVGDRIGNRHVPNQRISDSEVELLMQNLIKRSIVWNQATASLFKDLVRNRSKMKYIVAHSQGNLITSNALFVLEEFLGSQSLQKVRVYSLASPSPAWPVGLSKYSDNQGGGRQVNGFMNDLVALLRPQNLAAKVGVKSMQSAGDFRTDGSGWKSVDPLLRPHEAAKNMQLNFLKSIRRDLGLNPNYIPDVDELSKAVKGMIRQDRNLFEWIDHYF